MRMFRKNILWIAIGNRNGLLLISKKSFSKGLTDLPPQHLMLNACRMALRLFCLPLAAVGQVRRSRHPVLKGIIISILATKTLIAFALLDYRIASLTDIPRRPVKFSAKQSRKVVTVAKTAAVRDFCHAMIAMAQ